MKADTNQKIIVIFFISIKKIIEMLLTFIKKRANSWKTILFVLITMQNKRKTTQSKFKTSKTFDKNDELSLPRLLSNQCIQALTNETNNTSYEAFEAFFQSLKRRNQQATTRQKLHSHISP